MANIKSQIKRNRQNERRRVRNNSPCLSKFPMTAGRGAARARIEPAGAPQTVTVVLSNLVIVKLSKSSPG